MSYKIKTKTKLKAKNKFWKNKTYSRKLRKQLTLLLWNTIRLSQEVIKDASSLKKNQSYFDPFPITLTTFSSTSWLSIFKAKDFVEASWVVTF